MSAHASTYTQLSPFMFLGKWALDDAARRADGVKREISCGEVQRRSRIYPPA